MSGGLRGAINRFLDFVREEDRKQKDPDGDGLPTDREKELGSDPFDPDTDDDGLNDLQEAELGTNPRKADTDGDGLDDVVEAIDFGGLTDPNKADTDGDGLTDLQEVSLARVQTELEQSHADEGIFVDPTRPDTDGDGVSDLDEVKLGTRPDRPDTDGDGVDDGAELRARVGDPLDPAVTPAPPGAGFDTDGDGLPDDVETYLGTDPYHPDSDRDGVSDGVETNRFFDGDGTDADPLDPKVFPPRPAGEAEPDVFVGDGEPDPTELGRVGGPQLRSRQDPADTAPSVGAGSAEVQLGTPITFEEHGFGGDGLGGDDLGGDGSSEADPGRRAAGGETDGTDADGALAPVTGGGDHDGGEPKEISAEHGEGVVLESITVVEPDGSETVYGYDPETGQWFDAQGNPIDESEVDPAAVDAVEVDANAGQDGDEGSETEQTAEGDDGTTGDAEGVSTTVDPDGGFRGREEAEEALGGLGERRRVDGAIDPVEGEPSIEIDTDAAPVGLITSDDLAQPVNGEGARGAEPEPTSDAGSSTGLQGTGAIDPSPDTVDVQTDGPRTDDPADRSGEGDPEEASFLDSRRPVDASVIDGVDTSVVEQAESEVIEEAAESVAPRLVTAPTFPQELQPQDGDGDTSDPDELDSGRAGDPADLDEGVKVDPETLEVQRSDQFDQVELTSSPLMTSSRLSTPSAEDEPDGDPDVDFGDGDATSGSEDAEARVDVGDEGGSSTPSDDPSTSSDESSDVATSNVDVSVDDQVHDDSTDVDASIIDVSVDDEVQEDTTVREVPDLLAVDDAGTVERGFQTDFDIDEDLRVAATAEEAEPKVDDPRELLAEEDVSLPEGVTFGGFGD